MIYSSAVKQIHIIATSCCNLNCSYCYEKQKGGELLDVDKLFIALEKELLATPADLPVILSMHGGEPLLAFREIEKLMDIVWSQFESRKILVNIITNGTVLSDKIKKWLLYNRKRVDIAVSLDGLPEVHNRNRCNSYSKIDIDFFRSLGHGIYAKMTVGPSAIPYLTDGFTHLYNLGFIPHVSMAAECVYTENDLNRLSLELNKLIQFYGVHTDIIVTELLDIPFERMSVMALKKNPAHRCGVGCFRAAFDMRGNRYPCQTFINDFRKEYSIDEFQRIYTILESKNWKNISPQCSDCSIAHLCSPCYGLNYCNRKSLGALDENLCKINKIRIAAAAKLWAELIANKNYYPWMSAISDEELTLKADGIVQYLKNLKRRV